MIDQTTATSEPKSAPPQDMKPARTESAGIPEGFTLPGFDMQSLVQSRQCDIDAVTKATSIAIAGAQTVVDKQAELLKTVLAQLREALRSLPQDAAHPANCPRKQHVASDVLSTVLKTLKQIAIASSRIRGNLTAIRGLAAKLVQPKKNVAKLSVTKLK